MANKHPAAVIPVFSGIFLGDNCLILRRREAK